MTQSEVDMIDALRIMAGVLFVFLLGVVTIAAGAPRIAVGEPFPVLRFPALEDGRALSVTSFRGQKLVLHIFASW